MGEDIPRRIKVLIALLLVSMLIIPNILSSETVYVQEQIPKPIELTIDELITLYANKYSVDEELARNIIFCESSFKPDAINKRAVVGEDVGLFQLNTYYWQDHMADRNWNIYDTEDNIEAGMWLMNMAGTTPWGWSKPCWSNR